MTSLVSFNMWAFDEAQLKNFTTYGALAPIVVGLIIFKFAVSAMVRSIVLIVALVLGVLIFTQHSKITDCAEKAKESKQIDCDFYGYHFKFKP